MKSVLVSGASGFVGQALCPLLAGAGWTVHKASRLAQPGYAAFGSIGPDTDWRAALEGAGAVIHLAARVHVMHDNANDPLALFRTVNRDASANLARQAAQAGVKRFIYLSSIKVNGESTSTQPFRPSDPPQPQDPYAISKWEAEQELQRIGTATGLEIVVLRPPLVYGPGVKANFLRLLKLVERGIPLPLGAVNNRRSLLYLGNLADAIRVCLEHPSAAGKILLPSDGTALSSAALVRAIAAAMGKTPRLLPIPPALLKLAGLLTGKSAEVARLLDSLEVEDSALRTKLGWQPPYTLEQGLTATAAWYRGAGEP